LILSVAPISESKLSLSKQQLKPMNTPKERIRRWNQKPVREDGQYVLYWIQTNRRLSSNHSLDYAVQLAKSQNKELVVYEGLKKNYPWSSSRIHKFILETMIDNRIEAKRIGLNYWSFVEDENNHGKGILKKISEKASVVITDDFPCFIIPEQSEKLASKIDCAMLAVDGNSIIPFSQYEKFASAARILRIWVHKKFPEFFVKFAKRKYEDLELSPLNFNSQPPFKNFDLDKSLLEMFLKKIKFEADVPPNPHIIGGREEALNLLEKFLASKISQYAEGRSNPNSFENTPVSGLSPYLHFGNLSAEEIFLSVIERVEKNGWDIESLSHKKVGDRENFFTSVPAANHFLDELIVWRDIGYLYFFKKPGFRINLSELPDWVKKNFQIHAKDKREYTYSLEEFENANTHDELWNAAQNELKICGRMHNYMRMLWGKKVIEWSQTYEEAFDTLEYLNNKYAYDGRNPNSYTGILWCFGLFDRPWFPERNVLGNVRYMSSDSTRKKFKMNDYLKYVDSLQGKSDSLFP